LSFSIQAFASLDGTPIPEPAFIIKSENDGRKGTPDLERFVYVAVKKWPKKEFCWRQSADQFAGFTECRGHAVPFPNHPWNRSREEMSPPPQRGVGRNNILWSRLGHVYWGEDRNIAMTIFKKFS